MIDGVATGRSRRRTVRAILFTGGKGIRRPVHLHIVSVYR